MCLDLATQLGVEIVSEFVDRTRADTGMRPGLTSMLAYLKRTPTELVISSRGRYLAKRDQYHNLILQIGRLGTTVITSDRQIYPFGPTDRTAGPD